MLATLGERGAGAAAGRLFEVKLDGDRAVGRPSAAARSPLFGADQHDLTGALPTVVNALREAYRTPDSVLDGEVFAIDEHGRPPSSPCSRPRPGTTNLLLRSSTGSRPTGEPLVDLPLARAPRATGPSGSTGGAGGVRPRHPRGRRGALPGRERERLEGTPRSAPTRPTARPPHPRWLSKNHGLARSL